MRPPRNFGPQRPAPQDGPRINDWITAKRVRLIDHNGENVGIVDTREALGMAEEAGLDLVEIAAQSDPPVCKILDYGKFKFEAQKKAAQARKNQKVQEIKEIVMRPGIDVHDFDVKMKAILKFLGNGDKVRCSIRFRGREMAHREIGLEVLEKVRVQIADAGKVEAEPKLEGRQIMMVLAPR